MGAWVGVAWESGLPMLGMGQHGTCHLLGGCDPLAAEPQSPSLRLALALAQLTTLRTDYWPPKTSDELIGPREPIGNPYSARPRRRGGGLASWTTCWRRCAARRGPLRTGRSCDRTRSGANVGCRSGREWSLVCCDTSSSQPITHREVRILWTRLDPGFDPAVI